MTFLWKPKGFKNVFLFDGGGAVHCSPQLLTAAYAVPGIVTIPDPDGHTQMLKSMLALSGMTLDDLIKE